MIARIELTGQTFGRWTVLAYAGGRKWRCACTCGFERTILGCSLRNGRDPRCQNCFDRNTDMIGQTFGYLTVVERRAADHYGLRWLCRCDCGQERVVRGAYLRNGTVSSCGCTTKERMSLAQRRHGMSKTSEWHTWSSMKRRCNDPSHSHYRRYGGRGIAVCEQWNVFENFFEDMGPKPSPKHTLDRIDNDGNYEPGNCRWATWHEQQNNRSSNRLLTCRGKTQTVTQWARERGMPQETLDARLRRGWTVERSIFARVIPRNRPAWHKEAGRGE